MISLDVVHCLSSLPASDGNFTSALNRASDNEITQAIQDMKASGGQHKGRITACQRELRKREKESNMSGNKMTKKAKRIKPCPFCGGKAEAICFNEEFGTVTIGQS